MARHKRPRKGGTPDWLLTFEVGERRYFLNGWEFSCTLFTAINSPLGTPRLLICVERMK